MIVCGGMADEKFYKSRRERTRSSSKRQSSSKPNHNKVSFKGRKYPSSYEDLLVDSKMIDDIPKNEEEDHINLPDKTIIMSKYKIVRIIGRGAFGKVFQARDVSTNQEVAIKVIRKVKKYRNSAKYEIFVLNYLNMHHDVNNLSIELIDYFSYFDHACILFPKYGLSIYELMKTNEFMPFHSRDCLEISHQLCQGVNFLQMKQIIHTDLKPENIIFVDSSFETNYPSKYHLPRLNKSTIRIIDYGNSIFFNDRHGRIVCTRNYRPPEVILELKWDEKIDVWSIGCIIFEIVTAITLFQVHNNTEHLAFIECIIGKIPKKMIRRTNLQKYFDRDKYDWSLLSHKEREHVDELVELDCYFNRKIEEEAILYRLVDKMLELDPEYRHRMNYFIQEKLWCI
ncbi:MAG: Dual specificity protein kinase clk2 [Marteilia pararefringens]